MNWVGKVRRVGNFPSNFWILMYVLNHKTSFLSFLRPPSFNLFPTALLYIHKSAKNIIIQDFTASLGLALSYMKKVGLCASATMFFSECRSRLRYADGENVGPQSPKNRGIHCTIGPSPADKRTWL